MTSSITSCGLRSGVCVSALPHFHFWPPGRTNESFCPVPSTGGVCGSRLALFANKSCAQCGTRFLRASADPSPVTCRRGRATISGRPDRDPPQTSRGPLGPDTRHYPNENRRRVAARRRLVCVANATDRRRFRNNSGLSGRAVAIVVVSGG